MEAILTYSTISLFLAFFVSLSGLLLIIKKEPYKPVVFATHKITVVALTVFLVLIIIKHLQYFSFSEFGFTLLILATLFYVIAFVSGAVLSFESTARNFLKTIHKASSLLTIFMVPVIWLICH